MNIKKISLDTQIKDLKMNQVYLFPEDNPRYCDAQAIVMCNDSLFVCSVWETRDGSLRFLEDESDTEIQYLKVKLDCFDHGITIENLYRNMITWNEEYCSLGQQCSCKGFSLYDSPEPPQRIIEIENMKTAEKKGHKTDRMIFYCPLKLYFFPNCTEKDFLEIEDLDEQYVWDEVELKAGHGSWLEPLRRLMSDIEGSRGKNLSFIDEPVDARYDRFKDIISGNTLSLKVVGDQAWLAVEYELEKEIAPEDIPLLKEYAAEQFILFDGFYFGGHWTVPCQGGIFAVTANAAGYYRGPNSYNLEENHLLSERELSNGGEIQLSPLSL